MPSFSSPGEEPPPIDEQEQERSLAEVERGGIPLAAQRRLRELGEHGGLFTSDLSVSEYALCHQYELRPLSQVMGSSIYQVGWQSTPWPSMMGGAFMYELDALSEAWNEVRRRALGRLEQEAAHLGADAVVGVQLSTGAHDWAENSIEYMVVGTAVSHPERSRASKSPVLTELSVADYAKLIQGGFQPAGIVAWSSVFFVAASQETQMMGGLVGRMGFPENQELGEYTQGVYEARESVVQRMSAQAAQLNASGVVGVRINHGISRVSMGSGTYQRGGLMVNFHAVGTAIRQAEEAPLYAPETTIDLTT